MSGLPIDRYPFARRARRPAAMAAALVLPALAVSILSGRALAATAPMALVIGNSTYSAYPALPACRASAGLLASQLKRAGFDVTLATDLTNGAFDAALSDFGEQARKTPQTAALLYICAYGGSFDGRDFVLPVSATLSRPTDVMTEGVVARSAMSFTAGRSGASIVAIDLVGDPALGLGPPSGAVSAGQMAGTASVIIASETRPPAAATVFAATLAKQATRPDANAATLLPGVARALAGAGGVTIAGVRPATIAAALSGTPAAVPGAQTAAPAKVAPGGVAPAGTTTAGTTTAGAAPAAPRILPDDEAMTPAQRRLVQIALAKLGYYDGRLDGIFGPDSRAAIRRYQHEIGAPMSGTLLSAEASRLVSAAP